MGWASCAAITTTCLPVGGVPRVSDSKHTKQQCPLVSTPSVTGKLPPSDLSLQLLGRSHSYG
jgi:hypothetical protein